MNKFSMGNAFNAGKALVMQRPALYIGLLLLAQIFSLVALFVPMGGAAGMAAMANPNDPAAIEELLAGGLGVTLLLAIIFALALQFMGYYAVWRHGLANGRVSVGEAIMYGLKACLPALLFAIVAYIVMGIATFPIAFIAGASNSPALGVVLGFAAFFGLVYVVARLSIMGPEMAANNSLNPFAAAGRSWRATSGNGWMIALFFVVVYVVFFILYMIAAMIGGGIAGSLGGIGAFIVMMIIFIPVLVVGIFLGVGLPAGIYQDLVGVTDRTEIFS